MCSLERFKIDLKEVTSEAMALEWNLDDGFFSDLGSAEVQGGALHVSASIRKVAGFFELCYHAAGTVSIPCDRCLDLMEQPIDTSNRLTVKLVTGLRRGSNDTGSATIEDDDTVTVDEDEGILDTAWLIYESIVLAIPIKHVHAPGKCNSAMTQKLSELSGAARSSEEEAGAIDPRWGKLKDLKIEEQKDLAF